MSSIVNKIKEAVNPSHNTTSDAEGSHGPHTSRAANAADPRVDSDNDRHQGIGNTTGQTTGLSTGHTTGHTAGSGLTSGNHGLAGAAPNTAGPHSSDMANRADPRVDSDRDNSTTLGGNQRTGYNVAEGTHGPHGSRAANTIDPRVDSDHDRTVGLGSGSTGATTGSAFGSSTGAGSHFSHGTHGTAEGYHGPHSTRAANALDPRVDSDRDGSHNTAFGATGTHGTGTHGTGTDGTSEGLHGPHGSRVANALDPRVDSDRDGSRTAGNTSGTHSTGTHGTGISSGTHGTGTHGTAEGLHGPHSSRAANALDPRVDSDRDGRAQHTGGHATSTGDRVTGHVGSAVGGVHGTGPAPGTAGPHKSDILNKLDPRVDSDLDGSKTIGGDKTYAQSTPENDRRRFDNRDPRDATQVPPSVMKRHIGDPQVMHDDHGHDREARNAKPTHQESFSGI